MAGPSEWRIDDIERKANAAAPAHAVDALRSEVASVERAVTEVESALAGLRTELQSLQARVERLELPDNP